MVSWGTVGASGALSALRMRDRCLPESCGNIDAYWGQLDMGTIKEDVAVSADWISRALNSSGYRADFTPQSLWEIDRFFDEHSQNGAGRPGGLLSSGLGPRVFAIGSYIGEVVRRGVGGEWSGDDSDPEAEINVELQLPDGTRCWPVQRVMKRFKNGVEDGIAAWGAGAGLEVGPAPKPPQKSPRKGFFERFFG